MRTAYVVLLLTMLSAASSYGFEIGISGGVRNLETARTGYDPGAPMVSVTAGRRIVPALPFRIDAVASAWRSRVAKVPYDFIMFGGSEEDSRPYHVVQPGFQFGVRTQAEFEFLRLPYGMRPAIGAGMYWATDRAELDYERYWRDGWGAEAVFGLAIPFGHRGAVVAQYGIAGDFAAENDDGTVDWKDMLHYFTLGYRFRAFEKEPS